MNRVSLVGVLRAKACCFLKGVIDDVRVYNFALSHADVKTVVSGGQPKFRGGLGTFGLGCGSGPLSLTGRGEPAIGKTLALQLVLGSPKAFGFLFLGAQMRPMDLSGLGFKGCVMYTFPIGVMSMGAFNSAGSSNVLSLPIPNNTVLVSGVFYLQGVTLRSSPSLGLEASNSLVLRLGL